MRTRKLPALLLVLAMSLTMGGMTAFADEAEKELVDGVTPILTETAETVSDPLEELEPSIKVTGIPTDPVKGGDTVSYTVEVGPGDFEGWYIAVIDKLWDEVEGIDGTTPRKINLVDGKAAVSYKIPEDHFFYEASYYCSIEAKNGGDDNGIYVPFASHSIPAQRITLDSNVDFQTAGVAAEKEYPFTVTWTNGSDVDINDFATNINVGGTYGPEELGLFAQVKVTELPEGAVPKQEFRSFSINNMSIPAGQTIRISGTILFPAESNDGYINFEEYINGKWFGRANTEFFTISAPTGGNEEPAVPQPGTETSGITVKDEKFGITVSGVEEGVELSVKSVSKDQQDSIEEKVKKLVKNVKGIKIFDISLLKDGKEVQPAAPVKVTIPVPDGFGTNLKLYHQNAQEALEQVDISVENSTISFEAKSFSPYVLVDLGVQEAKEVSRSPKTGDASSAVLYLMLALAAMGSVGYAVRKRSQI